eukprot:5167546-Karenia_brevis.AAC.1
MMLGVSNVRMVNDLIFLEYLTDGNHAFTYMAHLFRHLVYRRKPADCAQHMQLPANMDNVQYWRDLICNA